MLARRSYKGPFVSLHRRTFEHYGLRRSNKLKSFSVQRPDKDRIMDASVYDGISHTLSR